MLRIREAQRAGLHAAALEQVVARFSAGLAAEGLGPADPGARAALVRRLIEEGLAFGFSDETHSEAFVRLAAAMPRQDGATRWPFPVKVELDAPARAPAQRLALAESAAGRPGGRAP